MHVIKNVRRKRGNPEKFSIAFSRFFQYFLLPVPLLTITLTKRRSMLYIWFMKSSFNKPGYLLRKYERVGYASQSDTHRSKTILSDSTSLSIPGHSDPWWSDPFIRRSDTNHSFCRIRMNGNPRLYSSRFGNF